MKHYDIVFIPKEDSGTTSDYGSREGEVEDDVLVEEDPEKIRKAGNDLFNAENIEGALEKYKEAIACGERGSQMSADSLSKTYRWLKKKEKASKTYRILFLATLLTATTRRRNMWSQSRLHSIQWKQKRILSDHTSGFASSSTNVKMAHLTPLLQGGAQLQDAGEPRHVGSCPDKGQGHADHGAKSEHCAGYQG